MEQTVIIGQLLVGNDKVCNRTVTPSTLEGHHNNNVKILEWHSERRRWIRLKVCGMALVELHVRFGIYSRSTNLDHNHNRHLKSVQMFP